MGELGVNAEGRLGSEGDSPLVVFLLQTLHVLRNVSTEDVFLQYLSVQRLILRIIARESLVRVGDEDATIAGSLERTKDSRASRCAFEASIQVCLEWAGSVRIVEGFSHAHLAGGFLHTLIFVGEIEPVECSAGDEQAGSIGRGPLGVAVIDDVA